MEVKVRAKKWGSSIGVIIPKEIVDARKIKENDEITIEIKKDKPKAGELFGLLADWKTPTQQIKDEMRRGWESGSDRKMREEWKRKQTKKKI